MGVRQERRLATRAAIIEAARRHVATDGAASLSLRAVARDLDLAVSALYRYFADREALLTELIVEAYDECADAVEAVIAANTGASRARRRRAFVAAAGAYRHWAQDNPSRFLLIFGTPVPGYVAPDRTTAAGTRIPLLLIGLLDPGIRTVRLPRQTRVSLDSLAQRLGVEVDAAVLASGITAWDAVHGHVMAELSGQLGPANADDGLFDVVVRNQLEVLGL